MILVTGATGNIGTELVAQLSDSGERVRALVRDPQRATLPAGVEAVVGDLNQPESMAEALDGVDGMFLMPGYAGMPELLARAKRLGCNRLPCCRVVRRRWRI